MAINKHQILIIKKSRWVEVEEDIAGINGNGKNTMKTNYSPGVAQWIECQPADQKVTSSISGQGTCLGCRPGLHVRGNPH